MTQRLGTARAWHLLSLSCFSTQVHPRKFTQCVKPDIFLTQMPDEEAFCVFVRLMRSYNLRTIYLPEMPGLQLRLYQFDRLVEELLPVLYAHFLRQGVKSSMYCSQWFLTMFSYR